MCFVGFFLSAPGQVMAGKRDEKVLGKHVALIKASGFGHT
jgi:hypothetical protein